MTAASAVAGLRGRLEAPSLSPRPDWPMVGGFAALTVLIHFLTNGRYGYFRDELYFIACAEHLAAGYVDLPPMVALVAKFTRATMGDSLFALRFFPALAGGATVAMAGILAAQLGGARFAQALAMLATMCAPIFLGVDTILTMNAFDPIFWMGCAYAIARIVKGGDPRWWLMFGVSAGLGLENKESMLFLGFAMVAGLALTPERKFMLTRWLLVGGLIALVIFLPTLMWQAAHHFPMFEELGNVKASTKNAPVTWLGFLGAQVVYLLPASFAVFAAGLWFFFISANGNRFRVFGWTWVILYAAFVMLKGKYYYIAPIYPVMLAGGSVQLGSVAARGWRQMVRYALPAIVLIEGVVAAPMAIPVLPVETFLRYQRASAIGNPPTETRKLGTLPQIYSDMFGWPEMVATVAKVYWSLPEEDRKVAGIFTANYGEAGAIDFFGPRYGLPKAISGHLSYYTWGPRDYTGKVMIVVGTPEDRLKRVFGSVEVAAQVGTEYSMPDEHVPVFICRDLKIPMSEMWARTKVFR